MMNPLQAMMQARQANQMGGLGLQSQGAQQMTPLLQQAQMNVANPTMMQAQPARLMEMDKYKYVNAAQDRAQKDKELLFNALDAKEARSQRAQLTQMELAQRKSLAEQEMALRQSLQDQKDAAGLSLEEIKNKYANEQILSQKKHQLEVEKQKLEMAKEAALIKQELLTEQADEKYGRLRKPTVKIIDDYSTWIGGRDKEFRNKLYNDTLEQEALGSITELEVQNFYKGRGYQASAYPKFGDDNYRKVVKFLYQNDPRFAQSVADLGTVADRQTAQATQAKQQAYTTTITQLKALGYSLPSMQGGQGGQGQVPSGNPLQPSAPVQVNSVDVLPDLTNGKGVDTGGDTGDKQDYSTNALIYDFKTQQPGMVTEAVKGLGNEVVDAVADKDNALILGAGLGTSKAVTSSIDNARLNNSLRPDLSGKETGGTKNPLSYRKDYDKRMVRDAFKKTADKFGGGFDKIEVKDDKTGKMRKIKATDIDNMDLGTMRKVIKSSREGFLKKWGKRVKGSFFMKDAQGNVIKDANGKAKGFKLPEIMKGTMKAGGAIGGAMIAWDLITAMSPEEVEELRSDINNLNTVSQVVNDSNNTFSSPSGVTFQRAQ